MPTSQLRRVLQTLGRDEAGESDGQLLERYVRSREEAAFAALVRRLGPMVWGVCRRVLAGYQDAEDAFQATFLVLVRKAAAVMPREMVANWLYGVAHQTARKARAVASKRCAREKQVTAMPEPAARQPLRNDLERLLDEELSRLPDKYRAVVVLCDLEGKTRKEAARHFRVPEGTVASRLATARGLLAKRLARHGLAVSGTALATILSQAGASAAVPMSVASSTIQAATVFAAGQVPATGAISLKAAALAEGVLKTMLLTKLKIATAVLAAVAVLGVGAAALSERVRADRPAAAEKPADPPATPKKELAGPPAKEEKPAEARSRVVTGIVKSVDADKKTLTVTNPDGEASFSVAGDAHISIDGKPGDLTRLPVGSSVCMTLRGDQNTVGALSANGASVFGKVGAVDAGKSTITATGPSGDQTFRVTADTAIVIDGKPGKLEAIPVGANLHALNLCVDQQTVHSVNVEGPGFHHVPVKAVDAATNTLTFDAQAPAEVAGKTFPVAADLDVRIDERPGKLAEIPAGSFGNITLTIDSQAVRRISAEGAHLGECGGSLVKTVDATAGTITFAETASADVAGKTFTVAKDAFILIDGRTGQLTGVTPGTYVNLILSVDQKTARRLHVQGPAVSGTVKAVNASENSITVGDRTFRLASDAVIVIDGRRSQLAGLTAGSSVTVRLHVDGQTVGMIQAKAS